MEKGEVFEVNPKTGLTREQVRKARSAGLVNTAVKPPSKSVGKIIATNTFTYFNFVFATIAVLLCLVRSYRDITFLPIIIANTLIGIV
ncbi:cation-translocating P-type ATPase, partial [Candidatus Saccharibacteria bacterium]|nr:cation-translocating P-type ATPase [Candidatus Saccharibacteria bacterium]